ncbi:ribosomal protein S6 kinase alpha-1 isoform X1 [Arapaima gigas]
MAQVYPTFTGILGYTATMWEGTEEDRWDTHREPDRHQREEKGGARTQDPFSARAQRAPRRSTMPLAQLADPWPKMELVQLETENGQSVTEEGVTTAVKHSPGAPWRVYNCRAALRLHGTQ